jgi:hypothetical protein
MMSKTQLQHYVPRFLLRRFVNPSNGRVFVFNKQNDAVFCSNPDKIGAVNGIYDCKFNGVRMTLEPSLAALDSRAASQIARILKDGRLDVSDTRQKAEISRFLAVQFVRTRAHQVMSADLFARMQSHLRSEGMDERFFKPEPELEDPQNAENAHRIRLISQAPMLLGPALADKDWLLLKTDSTNPFFLGDHPVTLHNDIDRGLRGNLGIGVEGIQIYFPLSPRFALALFCRSHLAGIKKRIRDIDEAAKRNGQSASHRDKAFAPATELIDSVATGKGQLSLPANVQFFNSLQISSAEQFVYSSVNAFSLVSEMLAKDEELRRGRRMSEANGAF